MTSITTKPDSSQPEAEATVNLFDNWFDPIETGVRERVREFIHAMIEGELELSTAQVRKQFERFSGQTQQLTTLAQKVTTGAAQPFQAEVAKTFNKSP